MCGPRSVDGWGVWQQIACFILICYDIKILFFDHIIIYNNSYQAPEPLTDRYLAKWSWPGLSLSDSQIAATKI